MVPTEINGAFVLRYTPIADSRGHFFRWFCSDIFATNGVDATWVQANQSMTLETGTIRGLHYQQGESAEQKLVRCISGQIFGVIADVHPRSSTYGKSLTVILSENEQTEIFVPRSCAFGFQSLSSETTVMYLVDRPYSPADEMGVRWDDPTLAIAWPLSVSQISERDSHLPYLTTDFIK